MSLSLGLAVLPGCIKTKDCDDTLPCAAPDESCFRGFCHTSCKDPECAGDDEICRPLSEAVQTVDDPCTAKDDPSDDVACVCVPCLCETRCDIDELEVCVDGACLDTTLDLTTVNAKEVRFCVEGTEMCFSDFTTRFCKGKQIPPPE